MEKKTEITPAVLAELFEPNQPDSIFDLINQYHPARDLIQRLGGYFNLRKMYDNDDEIAAAIDTRQEACVSTNWTLEGGEDEENELLYEYIAPHVNELVNYLWWAVPYGYGVVEVVYDEEHYNNTGFIKPKKILDQPFEEFEPKRDGSLCHRRISYKQDEKPVQYPEKYIHVVRKPSYHYPEGEPLFTRLYYAWLYRCHGWQYFMEYLETYSKPFIHAKSPGNEATLKQIDKLLKAEKRPTAVTTDKDTDLDIKHPTNNSSPLFELMNKGTSERIQRLILGQTLTSGTTGQGSNALGNVHNEVRHDKRRSDCKLVAQGVQKLVNYIYHLNRFEGDIPVFKMEDPRGLESDRANRDAVLAQSLGVKFTEKYLIESYNLDSEDIAAIEQDVSLDLGGFNEHNHDFLKFMSGEGLNARQKASFDLETDAINKAGSLLDADEMKALIRSSKTKKDLEKNLQAFVAREEPQFMDLLTQALYLSNLKGYVDGKEKVEDGS